MSPTFPVSLIPSVLVTHRMYPRPRNSPVVSLAIRFCAQEREPSVRVKVVSPAAPNNGIAEKTYNPETENDQIFNRQ